MVVKLKLNILKIAPKFRDPSQLSPEQLTDPDYRLKQLEKLNRGKLSITCSKCHLRDVYEDDDFLLVFQYTLSWDPIVGDRRNNAA